MLGGIIVGEKLCDVFLLGDYGIMFVYLLMGIVLGLMVLNILFDDGLM